jgi:hypothetical protein
MSKTHTTTQILTASKFNSHDSTGNCVLEIGPVLFNGTIVTIGGYKVRYNGIIFETTDVVTHDTAGYNYLCVAGIDASPTSTPYTLVTNVKQGICLIERYHDGWITRDNKFKGDFRGLPFTRTSNAAGLMYLACYGPGVCNDGTLVHTPIQLPWDIDAVTGSQAYPGNSDLFFVKGTNPLGTVTGYGCSGHLVIYSESTGPTIEIKNNRLWTTDTIAGAVGACHAIIEKSDTHCNYAYSSGANLYIGECEYGVAAGAPTTYTMSANVAKVDFVTPTTVVVQLADNTFVYGMIMPTTIDPIFSGSSRWFHVDHKNGDFVHIGTDDKLYLNAVEVGSTTHFAFVFDKQIIQVNASGDIIHGGKTSSTGFSMTDVVASRTYSNDLFLMFISGAGISLVSYNVYRGETTYLESLASAESICAVTFSPVAMFYFGSEEVFSDQPVAPGSALSDPPIEIIPSEYSRWRYNRKHFTVSGDRSSYVVFMDSNTSGEISYQVDSVAFGQRREHNVTSLAFDPVIVGADVCDGDYLESVKVVMIGPPMVYHYYTKCLAIDYDGNVKSALLTRTPDDGAFSVGSTYSISGNMLLSGGTMNSMSVYAADSVVYNATINNLDIYIAKNVMFVGCTIGACADHAVAPDTNEYQFIGCTIGGVPANTFQALTDTPMAYVSPGDMLCTNATTDGLEFATVAKQDYTDPVNPVFKFTRQDIVNETGALLPEWDQPAALDIHRHTGDPTGFENRTDSVLTYNPEHSATKGRLTLSGFGANPFYVWHNGIRYKFTDPVVWEHDRTWIIPADETQTFFMYFVESGGVLVPEVSNSFWNLSTAVPVAYVTYNKVIPGSDVPNLGAGFACEERHGMCMDWATHKHLHFTFGAHAESGFALTVAKLPYADADSNKIQIDPGVVADEDIDFDNAGHPAIGNYKLMCRYGVGGYWYWRTLANFPYDISDVSGFACANTYSGGSWDLRSLGHNNWMNVFFFATNAIDTEFQIVCIPGQTIHASLTAATGETVDSLQFGTLPFQEFPPLYRATYQTQNGYDAAAGKAHIVALQRITQSMVNTVATSVANHPSLSGLTLPGQHPATSISYASAEFDYGAGLEPILTCDQVQEALDQVIARFPGNATWAPGAPPTFSNFVTTPTWIRDAGAMQIVSVTADVLGADLNNGDHCHRKLVATLSRAAGGAYTILTQDSEIITEDATFEAARLDPAGLLDGVLSDYVELTVSGTTFSITCGAISLRASLRYSVNMMIHELVAPVPPV